MGYRRGYFVWGHILAADLAMTHFITSNGETLPAEVRSVQRTRAMMLWRNDLGRTVLIDRAVYEGVERPLDVGRTLMDGDSLHCRLELAAFK